MAKQVLEDSERDLLNALQQQLKKNNKDMLAVVTSAYVAGLQAFFATGVERVHGLKAQLHEKIATDEEREAEEKEKENEKEKEDEEEDAPEVRASAKPSEEKGYFLLHSFLLF
jgi:exonuclease VII large subunit